MDEEHSKSSWRYDDLINTCLGCDPIPTAVVHPCSRDSIRGAAEAAEAGLIAPILYGPEAKIRQTAEEAVVDISEFGIVATEHSHAAAEAAVAEVRSGKIAALMKGSLHTDELLGAVMNRERGIRTERRISHVFVMDVPSYPARS